MARSKTKPVSLDGIKHAMAPGHLETRACKDKTRRDYHIKDIQKMDAISFEMNHCMAFLDQNEALQLIASLTKSGYQQWGEPFLDQVQTWIEAVR
ncbi:MAG: hypothetical protein ABT940_03615 [Alphaproteobacteria bacterium]